MTSYDQHLIDIGKLIRRLRTENGWTQTQLAKQAQSHGASVLHRQEISQMENGSFGGSIRKLQAVLRSLRYTLSASVARTPQLDELEKLFDDEN